MKDGVHTNHGVRAGQTAHTPSAAPTRATPAHHTPTTPTVGAPVHAHHDESLVRKIIHAVEDMLPDWIVAHEAAPPVAHSKGETMALGGAKHLKDQMAAHKEAISDTGVGLYYGDHSGFKKLSPDERQQWVDKHASWFGDTPKMPKESSCIGWAMENVKAAYVAAGKGDRWAEIAATIIADKGDGKAKGTDLAKELKKDGWEAIYFNPDVRHPSDGNSEHPLTASQVAKGKPYYGIKVDHQVVNYRPSAPGDGENRTKQDMGGIETLRKAPFFFGIARGGDHTFVGHDGTVSEFHWDRMPNDKHSIEETPLEAFVWNSGLVMVPPGTWSGDKPKPAHPAAGARH